MARGRKKGFKMSDESLKKFREKMCGENHWAFGKKQSPHVVEARIKSLIGNKFTLGYKHSDETKKKMSASRKGHPTSEETRRKIGEKQKGEKNHNWKN